MSLYIYMKPLNVTVALHRGLT